MAEGIQQQILEWSSIMLMLQKEAEAEHFMLLDSVQLLAQQHIPGDAV